MADTVPLCLYRTDIGPEWLDYNDHLNVAGYTTLFDEAGVALFDRLGMGEAYSRRTGGSWVVLESHVTYDRELVLGDAVEVRSRLVDHDAKRLHLYHEIHKTTGDGGAASTCEQMTMFFDLNARRPADFPDHVMANIARLAADHAPLPRPANLGRLIGIKRRDQM